MQFSLYPSTSKKVVTIGTSNGDKLEHIASTLNVLRIKYVFYRTEIGYTFEFSVGSNLFHCFYLDISETFILTIESTLLKNIIGPFFLSSEKLRDSLFIFIYNLSGTPIDFYIADLIKFRQDVTFTSAKRVLRLANISFDTRDKTLLIDGTSKFSITLEGEWFIYMNENQKPFKRTNYVATIHKKILLK